MYYLNEDIDSGNIIDQYSFRIHRHEYAYSLYKKVVNSGKILLKRNLVKIFENTIKSIPQDSSLATYFPKRSLEKDNKIDLLQNADMIYRKIRAFSYPYLGAYVPITSHKVLRIFRVRKYPFKIRRRHTIKNIHSLNPKEKIAIKKILKTLEKKGFYVVDSLVGSYKDYQWEGAKGWVMQFPHIKYLL